MSCCSPTNWTLHYYPTRRSSDLDIAVKLTARQQQIFDLIRSEIQRTGFPPTRAEIAERFGFKSVNAAEDHLKALARKGAIELVRSEEHTSELQSRFDLVCRLLLE